MSLENYKLKKLVPNIYIVHIQGNTRVLIKLHYIIAIYIIQPVIVKLTQTRETTDVACYTSREIIATVQSTSREIICSSVLSTSREIICVQYCQHQGR